MDVKVARTPYRAPFRCRDCSAVDGRRRRRYTVTPPAVAPATTDAPPTTQRLPGTSVPITTAAATAAAAITTARNAIPKMVFHHRPARKDSNSISRIHAGSVGSIPTGAIRRPIGGRSPADRGAVVAAPGPPGGLRPGYPTIVPAKTASKANGNPNSRS